MINFNGVTIDPPDNEPAPHIVPGSEWAYTPHVGNDLLLVGIRIAVSANEFDWGVGERLTLSWGKVGAEMVERREEIDFYWFETNSAGTALPAVVLHGVTMCFPFLDDPDAVYCAYLDNATNSDRIIRTMDAIDGEPGTQPRIWIMRLAGALDF